MEILLALGLGLGLSAASGFRVFVPLLGLGLAGWAGWVSLPPGSEWLGTGPACLALGAATCLEIGGYYLPWLDNLLDSLAAPLAMLAGCLLALVAFQDFPPAIRWLLAVIAGGGASSVVQAGTMALRGLSTGTTAGLANPVVATLEAVASVILTLLALLLPLLALLLTLLLTGWLVRILARALRARCRSVQPHHDDAPTGRGEAGSVR
jgi:hypothetical protein